MQEIIELLTKNNNKKFIKNFLTALLTKTELETINRRWQIIKLLHQGFSQREIAKKLGTSLCSITRGSKEIKKKNNFFNQIFN